MSSRSNFEKHAPKFVDPNVSLEEKLKLATEEVRDKIEVVHSSEYGNFLKAYFPAFKQLLTETKPQSTETEEHKLRNVLLEILNRLPHNEVLR
eukprot:8975654-Pyramimonas_sp.AAC.1